MAKARASTYEHFNWNRRSFLKYVGAAFSTAMLPDVLSGCTGDVSAPIRTGATDSSLPAVFTSGADAVRPEDMVALRFDFANLKVDATSQRLVREAAGEPSYVALTFPPQHALEAAIRDTSTEPFAQATPLPSLSSAPSRVVFRLPDDFGGIDYSVGGILAACTASATAVSSNALSGDPAEPALPSDIVSTQIAGPVAMHAARALTERKLRAKLRRLHPRDVDRVISGAALRPEVPFVIAQNPNVPERGPGYPRAPGSGETSIELPARLVLSPNEMARWMHRSDPFQSPRSGRVELWHTRLGTARPGSAPEDAAHVHTTARAIWTRDPDVFVPKQPLAQLQSLPTDLPPNAGDETPLRGSMLDGSRRAQIVHQSSNFGGRDLNGAAIPTPRPFEIGKLMLSSLGGFLDAQGSWPEGVLTSWRHIATGGRDQYVATTDKGFLLPFGHHATLVEVGERVTDPKGSIAYVRRYQVIVVDEPIVAYDRMDLRFVQLPFLKVELLAKVTPRLNANGEGFQTVLGTNEQFVLPVLAMDRDGNDVRFPLCVYFTHSLSGTAPFVDYAKPANLALRTAPIKGQRVAFADETTHPAAYETHALTFSVNKATQVGGDARSVVQPLMEQAQIAVEAIRHLTDGGATVAVNYAKSFLDPSDPNPGELLFELAPQLPSIALSFANKVDRSGGFLSPNFNVVGISSKHGLLGGDASTPAKLASSLATAATGGFDPASFFASAFGGMSPTLFGVIDLLKLLGNPISPADVAAAALRTGMSAVPKFVTEAFNAVERVYAEALRLQERLRALVAHGISATATLPAEAQAAVANVQSAATDLQSQLDNVILDIKTGNFGALTGIPDFLSHPDARPDPNSHLMLAVRSLGKLADNLEKLPRLVPLAPPIGVGASQEIAEIARKLSSILSAVGDVADAYSKIQKGIEAAKDLSIKLEWRPAIGDVAPVFYLDKAAADPNGGSLLLSVEARAKAKKGPNGEVQKPGFDVLCSLENFSLHLLGDEPIIKFKFQRFRFSQKAGKKPDVDVVYKGFEFGHELKILNELKDIIPLDGFSDPPFLDITATDITAGFTVAVPDVAMGIFSLRNIKLGASLNLPFFSGALRWNFNFCSRKEPFNLAVGILGGGGYLTMGGSATGLDVVEGSLEFGAYLALDFGVASGSLSLAAGAYIHLNGSDLKFGGFLRLRGQIMVLGLVGLSVELRADLGYDSAAHELSVDATLTVEVDIGPFSKAVELAYHTSFKLGDSPAANASLPSASVVNAWPEYMAAFAA